MRLPRITIITPSYNQGEFLEATVKSVLDQNYPDLEFIVMDGGSRDNSPDIINRYAPDFAHWEVKKDQGQTHAINKGLALATGDIINWINSDDLLLPNALFSLAGSWQENPWADVFFGDYEAVDAHGALIYSRKSPPYHPKALVWGRQLSSQPAVFFSKQLLQRLGPLDQSLTFCMDTEFWIRAALAGANFIQVTSPLAATRVHGGAKTSRLQHVLRAEHRAVLARQGLVKTRGLDRMKLYALNRLWRGRAALGRALVRKDFSFFAASRALNQLT